MPATHKGARALATRHGDGLVRSWAAGGKTAFLGAPVQTANQTAKDACAWGENRVFRGASEDAAIRAPCHSDWRSEFFA